ncbi:E3 ubiquitin-protein ligase TRIM39-like [Cheilinus undulatus]|uniref:E3 ubiquitin-protein ligase TRIM39-like n=1 Tax=Cheilinus undulatus TaxID=241271 RepID=UPI001BD59898|nr:E3 ubiquitin-protein ligase TRIM39-like [Cheilinus undulatus]
MATASSLAFEEQLCCSICLHEFTDPVSTPCGHNYCMACITGYWSTSDVTQCPLCKKEFCSPPQLQVNTEFRDMVERFHSMRLRGEDGTIAQPGEVPCDVCRGPKLKAQKTCLLCLSSYCQNHLEVHQGVTARKKHQLIDPVWNLEDRVCKKHDKVFELFCQDDQTCVCVMCLRDDHVTHKAVPLEREITERKARLDDVASEIKAMETAKCRSIEEIKNSLAQIKEQSEKEMEEIAQVFTDLILSLQRCQAELVELIKGKQEAAEKQAEDLLKKLEQDVADLRRSRTKMEVLLTKDDLQLLQSSPPLDLPGHQGDQFDPLMDLNPPLAPEVSDISGQSYMGMVRTAVAQMEKMFRNDMETLIHEVRLSDGTEVTEPSGAAGQIILAGYINELWDPPLDKMMMIQQCDAVDVTLDADTAHSRLVVSENGKQLRVHTGRLFFPALFGHRFTHHKFILGKDGFSLGRFYFEVQVSGCNSWLLGVVKESFNRESRSFPLRMDGGWIFHGSNTKSHFAKYCGDISAGSFYLRVKPQRVGVFVDYEKGEVSFYDMDTRAQIYSYTGCNFTETTPPLKAFLYSMAGAPVNKPLKLYPILGIFGENPDDVLEINPFDPLH